VRFGFQGCGQIRIAAYTDLALDPAPPSAPACAPAPAEQQQPPPGGDEQPPADGEHQPQPETQPPPPDTTAPKLTIGGPTRQHPLARRRVSVSVMCDEDCSTVLRGVVRIGKRRIAPRTARKALSAGRRTTLVLKLTSRDARALRAALRQKRRTLAIAVTAFDAAGNRSARKRSIVLTR
jgi:hypothetical protein